MATNDEVLIEIRQLRTDVCERFEKVERQVGNHEKRLTQMEYDTTQAVELKALKESLNEFKTEWGNWQKRLFILVLLSMLMLAAVAGVNQIPKLPF